MMTLHSLEISRFSLPRRGGNLRWVFENCFGICIQFNQVL